MYSNIVFSISMKISKSLVPNDGSTPQHSATPKTNLK